VNGGGTAGGGGPTRTARIIRSNGTPVEFYVTSTGDEGALGDMGGGAGGGLFGLLAGAMNPSFGGSGGFVGNPGDYALGSNHLSQLINQLMQNDPNRHGAPPAAKEVVEKLPSHKVEQREVDANAECAVCKDLFAVDDDAKDLPCAHSFHPDCIMPWLKMHNSCPVCRFELPTDDQDYEDRRRHAGNHETTADARW
jgi:E3 ubiquitin-protein ligase RNF115/126